MYGWIVDCSLRSRNNALDFEPCKCKKTIQTRKFTNPYSRQGSVGQCIHTYVREDRITAPEHSKGWWKIRYVHSFKPVHSAFIKAGEQHGSLAGSSKPIHPSWLHSCTKMLANNCWWKKHPSLQIICSWHVVGTRPDVLQTQDLVEAQEAETSIMHRLRGRCSPKPSHSHQWHPFFREVFSSYWTSFTMDMNNLLPINCDMRK